jgi:hypothetical protein
MHVDMYDYQPAVTYTQTSKQTNVHTCVSVYLYVSEERERISVTLVTTAAQRCASDLCMCVCARVCWYYFANLRTVCLFVCRCTPWHNKTHIHTQATIKTQANTSQKMMENQHFHSSTVSQYSATRNTHTHPSHESPAKMSGCRADNWLLSKESCLYRGETES